MLMTTTNPSTTDWREEFDENYSYWESTSTSEGEMIKDFIRTLLSRKEEEVRKEILERLEKAKCDPGDIVTGWVVNMDEVRAATHPKQ